MAIPAQELTPEQMTQVRDIAERATTNPEQFREETKRLTEAQLNALANIFLQERKAELTRAVHAEIKDRLSTLDAETPNESLDDLLRRVPEVKTLLDSSEVIDAKIDEVAGRVTATEQVLAASKSSTERLADDIETTTGTVKSFIGNSYDYVRLNVVKPLADRTKDVFLIGPMLGSLAELSPHHLKNAVSRKIYEFMANMGGDGTGKNFFGKTLSRMADNARQKLAVMDIDDVLEEYREEKKPGESIALEGKITPDEWRQMKELLQKNPSTMGEKAAAMIAEQRKAGILQIRIRFADLLKTEAEVQELAKTERLKKLETTVLGVDAWKNVGVTSVKFSADETSAENGVLTIAESDLSETGEPKAGSRALALLEAKKTITNAGRIVIAKDTSDVVTFSWKGARTATLPLQTDVDLGKLNEIAGSPQPDKFSALEIAASDDIVNDEARLISRSVNGVTGNTLIVENNPKVLEAILERKLQNVTQDPPAKYKLDSSGNFTFMAPPTPARAEV